MQWRRGEPPWAVRAGQKANKGRIFIPVEDQEGGGRGQQHIWVIDKDDQGKVERKKMYGVAYVPLTDAPTGSSS